MVLGHYLISFGRPGIRTLLVLSLIRGVPCLLSIRGKEYLEYSTYHGFLVIISRPINHRTVLVGFCSVEVRFKKRGVITGSLVDLYM